MTDNEKIRTEQSLDEVLALMAEEVPPMPADFHDRWTKAVREEAAKTPTEPEKENNSKIVVINRWTRILSVAAVFVFLIGGTLIYRSSRPKAVTTLPAAEKQEEAASVKTTEAPAYEDAGAVMPAAEEPAREEAGAVYGMEAAEEEADMAVEAPAMANYAAAGETDAAMEEAAQPETPMLSMSASKEAVQMDMAAGEAAETEEAAVNIKGAKSDVAAAPEPEVHMTPDPTRAPEHEKEETEAEMPEKEPEQAAETKPEPAVKTEPAGFLRSIGDFFKDMGDFLLTVWPYLLILAVPAGAALIWRHRKKKSS